MKTSTGFSEQRTQCDSKSVTPVGLALIEPAKTHLKPAPLSPSPRLTTCLSSHLGHYGNLLIGPLILLLPLQTICGTAARVSQMMSLLCLKPFPGISPRVEAKVLSTADKPVHNPQDSLPRSLNFKHTAFLTVLKKARHVPSLWHVPLLFTLLAISLPPVALCMSSLTAFESYSLTNIYGAQTTCQTLFKAQTAASSVPLIITKAEHRFINSQSILQLFSWKK